MRYIDLNPLERAFSTDERLKKWLHKAQEAYNEVKNLPPVERTEAINKKGAIWRELKNDLRMLSHKKCWYCESLEVRSDTAVDHYRPKGEVLEAPAHPGYWWLAFAWKNYRYVCQFCNELRVDKMVGKIGGKLSHFPMVGGDESKRAFDQVVLLREEPALLDPTVMSDPLLLTFEKDGTAKPTWRKEQFPRLFERADISITYYHLNHTDLVERRIAVVCNEVEKLVGRGDKYFERLVEGDNSAEDAFNDVLKDLKKMMKDESEYAAAAKAVLKLYKSSVWVDAVVTTY